MPLGARLAELTRLKLEYDSAKSTLKGLQHELAELEERLSPEDLQSDRDRVVLIQEKEQLLREFRSVRSYTHDPLQVGRPIIPVFPFTTSALFYTILYHQWKPPKESASHKERVMDLGINKRWIHKLVPLKSVYI